MKTNINQTSLKAYSKIPTYWEYRPNQINYHNLPTEEHILDGWRDIVDPVIGENQRKGLLVYDEINDIAIYQVIDLTLEEIEAKNKVYVPFSITPTQGRLLLHQMGLLSTVKTTMESTLDEAMLIYWEYALSWDRDNSYIKAMAVQLGMNQDDLDLFFIEAEKIV